MILLTQAELEGLVHCPFCPFAAIMEDPTDRIFECANCGVLSCRYCRVKSHHPLTCESLSYSEGANNRV
jgi:TRIAD3 protein (E3 ubiquitin-protein ligase RNF216)